MGRTIGRRSVDHLGNVYASERAMCAAHGVPCATFRARVARGWGLGAALTAPVGPATDHEGTAFPSVAAMCRHGGARYRDYAAALAGGADLDALVSREMAAKRAEKEAKAKEGARG